MSDYVVLDHHHDKDAGVYRLTLGELVEEQLPVTDADGNPVLVAQPMLDERGEPLLDVDGKPIVLPGAPKLELQKVPRVVRDYVFADDDERWKGKSKEQVAQAQRADVKKQLAVAADTAREEAERRSALAGMPGSGGAL